MPRSWRNLIADEVRATSMMKPKPVAKVEVPRWALLMIVRNAEAGIQFAPADLERAMGELRGVLTPDEIATGRLADETDPSPSDADTQTEDTITEETT